MANSTYKIDISPLLFSGVRVRYNMSNNTQTEYTPPSLILLRQPCAALRSQSFHARNDTLYHPFTSFPFARHWPKEAFGNLSVITSEGEVRVYHGQSLDDYDKYRNCSSRTGSITCRNIDSCGHIPINMSGDVYIVICVIQDNTSFSYTLMEPRYNVHVDDTSSPILQPGDTFAIDVLFDSLLVEVLHQGKCTYLVTVGSDLQNTTPVIVELLLPRTEEFVLVCLCIFLSLVIMVAGFAGCCCSSYCRKKDVCLCVYNY